MSHARLRDVTDVASRALPAGVVFDCDGTIADTESLSDRAWAQTLAEHGYVPTSQDFAAVIGHPFLQNWAYFSERADLGDQAMFRARLRERFLELFDHELVIYPDAVATMRELAAAGVPIGVASSSSHAHVDRVLERGGVGHLVAVVVGADDVERHKPDPEPYQQAASRLAVPPSRCTAIEDTPVGLASAIGADMFTVGIVRSHVGADGLAAAHRVVDELSLAAVVPDADDRASEDSSWS